MPRLWGYGVSDDIQRHWREILERRLNQIGSQIKGSQDFAADRLADVIEMVEELRKDLEKVKERQDKIADYVKANVPKREKREGE
jgi:hypothetical protein